jgi:hypothetical protein
MFLKVIVDRLVKKFATFMVFSRHHSLCWANRTQTTPHTVFLRAPLSYFTRLPLLLLRCSELQIFWLRQLGRLGFFLRDVYRRQLPYLISSIMPSHMVHSCQSDPSTVSAHCYVHRAFRVRHSYWLWSSCAATLLSDVCYFILEKDTT